MAGSDKMSKSLGNVVLVNELLEQGWRGEEIRYAILTAHYRQPLEWSEDLLRSSRQTLEKYRKIIKHFSGFQRRPVDIEVTDSLCDDLNTPKAIAKLNEYYLIADAMMGDAKAHFRDGSFGLGKPAQRLAIHHYSRFRALADLLGLSLKPQRRQDQPARLRWLAEEAIKARNDARKARDFAEADRIRAELLGEGVMLEDGPQGTTWRRA
jgi:cysteinyl-tRNA synthetase